MAVAKVLGAIGGMEATEAVKGTETTIAASVLDGALLVATSMGATHPVTVAAASHFPAPFPRHHHAQRKPVGSSVS